MYLSACARRHGDDRSLEICWDVNPVNGFGNRPTSARIRELLRPEEPVGDQALIRGRFHKRKEAEAAVVFVRVLPFPLTIPQVPRLRLRRARAS